MSSINAANSDSATPPENTSLPQQPPSPPSAFPATTSSDLATSDKPIEENGKPEQLTINTESSSDGRSSDAEKMLDSAMDGSFGSDSGDPGNEPMVLMNTGDNVDHITPEEGRSWSEEESHELKRVKVYELIGARWIDQGTAFCFGDFQDNEALLIARAEGDYNQIVLSTTIRPTDVYQRQQDTLIVWTEPDGVDYALSFQDPEGCAEVWNFIQEVQRHMTAAENGLSSSPVLGDTSTTANIIRTGHLPKPSLGIIGEIERAIRVLTRTPALKERVCEYIQGEEYIKRLADVFKLAENLESIDNLHALCTCMQTILSLNDHSMFEHVMEDELFLGVIGMLEYDPDFPTYKGNYREFFSSNASYHQPIPIKDESIQKKIHHTYRLVFLKDVVLARSIDDSAFNVLNSCIIFNQIDIISHIQNDPTFLREVVGMFIEEDIIDGLAPSNQTKAKETGDKMDVDEPFKPNGSHPEDQPKEEDSARRREIVLLMQQLITMAKNVQIAAKTNLLRTLVDRGVLFLVQWAVAQPESEPEGKLLIAAAGDIITPMLEFDIIGVRGHVVKQLSLIQQDKEAGKKAEKGTERETVLMVLCKVFVRSKDLAVQTQLGEHLRNVLEIPTGDAEPHPILGARLYQRAKDDPGMEKFLDYFYKRCAEVLFKPLFDLPEFRNVTESSPLTISRERTNVLLHLCDLLSNFAVQHSFRSHFYMLSSNISLHIASLLKAKDKHLRLAALRFFRVLLKLNNRNIFNHLMKHDILKPLLELALQESRRDNLLSSTCLEFFEHMRRDNMKDFIHHCMTKHEDIVKSLAETPLGGSRFKAFIRRWEMNMEPPPKEEEKVEPPRPNGTGIRKWGQGRLLEAEEEDYFNADDDEDEIVPVLSAPLFQKAPPNSLKRKRPRGTSLAIRQQQRPPFANRTAPLGSLVDYDDADEAPASQVLPSSPIPSSSPFQQGRPSSPRISQQSQQAQKPMSISLTSGEEDEEDSLLESLVSKGASPPTIGVIKPPELNISAKRHREDDDDDELLERLASKAKRPSISPSSSPSPSPGPSPSSVLSGLKKKISLGLSERATAVAAGKPAEEGPKKITLKLTSLPSTMNTTSSPSSPGAKDGDTG